MYRAAFDDVALYYDILTEINRLIKQHPYTNRVYLAETVLAKMNINEEWFANMQVHHKQAIEDSVKRR